MGLDEAQKVSMNSKTLEEIFSSWHNSLESQTETFEKQVSKLRDAEIELYENLDSLTVLQETSSKVCSDYRGNLEKVNNIIYTQDIMAEKLNQMEKDLDRELGSKSHYSHINGSHDGLNKKEEIYQ